jgi:hypothetical protein
LAAVGVKCRERVGRGDVFGEKSILWGGSFSLSHTYTRHELKPASLIYSKSRSNTTDVIIKIFNK